jgi:hypothetical protein
LQRIRHHRLAAAALECARSTSAPTAPRAAAAAAKSAPSKFGPRSATNSAPAFSVRLSVDTTP